MQRLMYALSLAILAAAFQGCASQPRSISDQAFLVPSTALVSSRQPAINPYQVLPASDGDLYIPRGEKFVYGGTYYNEFSAYTLYTVDAQAIFVPGSGSSGYRYRWVVQQGLAAPAPQEP